MNIIERTRPKGFNKKVWAAMYKRAERQKAWAERTVKTSTQWARESSVAGLEMLGHYLASKPWKLAEESYRYLEMRAHAVTYVYKGSGNHIDTSAKRVWEKISGKRIGAKTVWIYDHTIHQTSAQKVDGKWRNAWNGKRLQKEAA